MRESNFSFPSQNRASVCITSALYDRRALDCTAMLPLINSLTHLTYLTSTSPRIREILTMDGGLERLVRILKTTKASDKRSGWKWSMAFQCVANVGVRGSEKIRTRVVEAGMIPVIITVLDNFLKALDHHAALHEALLENVPAPITSRMFAGYNIRPSEDARSDVASWGSVTDTEENNLQPLAGVTNTNTILSASTNTTADSQFDINVFYREEDILLSLQLLAYLSKYPHLRETFHNAYPPHNVFSLVEKFTQRFHPPDIQYWAGVIMRNACRKDDNRGGIRQCAYMACGKWEQYPREFAKCRRCRKAKYCSKPCQSKAWNEGHRPNMPRTRPNVQFSENLLERLMTRDTTTAATMSSESTPSATAMQDVNASTTRSGVSDSDSFFAV
ncbi:6199_t:CDS:2 [Paraglomus brasilianum]|uniref:6199_t:CDS:1 n=1 Tax=Paraglomus brasilianum TaxID=144538 RepID=A0A9N9AQD4_9GLOM|nr:6199_t:CDS:2 [Paraglomus brasilianum]